MTSSHVQDLFSLEGKVALITGATGHLGSEMAAALAEAGATVVASSRNIHQARAIAEALPTEFGQQHGGIEMDQLDQETIAAGFQQAVETAGQIDILVNNGHAAIGADWREVTGAEFNQQLANATGYFLLARRFHEHIVSRDTNGSLILLGSMYGSVGSYPDSYEGVASASPVAYHTLKGGVLQMTRHLAVYWAKDRVRVNSLSPGPFPSGKAPREMVARLETRSPMGRMGRPEELKGAIVFLASEASSYMTGQNLIIDGGWTAW